MDEEKRIVEYKVVKGHKDDVTRDVTDWLFTDWELYGYPFEVDGQVAQAMVKKGK